MTLGFLEECVAVLGRTPATLEAMLRGLPEAWTSATEGEGTWSPRVVVEHIIHAERVDWIPRLEIILKHGVGRPFDPFVRTPELDNDRTLDEALDELKSLREANLRRLREMGLQAEQLALRGTHPGLGEVTVRQLLATWTAHDLAHILQVSRVMAKRLKEDVGPWAEYLSVMR